MNFRQRMVEKLYNSGLFMDQAKAVVAMYEEGPLGQPMREHMGKEESGYPPTVSGTLWMGVQAVAVEWIDQNCPQHWARAVFTPMRRNQGDNAEPPANTSNQK